jgi:hypothetical protein
MIVRRGGHAFGLAVAGAAIMAVVAMSSACFTSLIHDVREIIPHVMTETTVHAGHLDAARELPQNGGR